MWGSSGNPEAFGATGSVARAASNGWYNNELNLFPAGDYGKASPDMSNFSDWGHFSQLVWKGTKKVGCATKFCPAGTLSSLGSWYTVCNYYPAGMLARIFLVSVLALTVLVQATWAAPTLATSSLPRARRQSGPTSPIKASSHLPDDGGIDLPARRTAAVVFCFASCSVSTCTQIFSLSRQARACCFLFAS